MWHDNFHYIQISQKIKAKILEMLMQHACVVNNYDSRTVRSVNKNLNLFTLWLLGKPRTKSHSIKVSSALYASHELNRDNFNFYSYYGLCYFIVTLASNKIKVMKMDLKQHKKSMLYFYMLSPNPSSNTANNSRGIHKEI